jgi:glycosyltransferase involved in cell wall biosynthesis
MLLLTDGLDDQVGGVQRVSRTVQKAALSLNEPFIIWSANDRKRIEIENDKYVIEGFERDYFKMGISTLITSFPLNCCKIYCWHLRLAPLALLLSWRLKCSYHVFLHGVEAWEEFSWKVSLSLKYVEGLSANSTYTMQRFHQAHPEFQSKPSKIIPLGLNREFLISIPNENILGDIKGSFILSVNRFEETYKGEETLLLSIKELINQGTAVQLVLVGEGPYRKKWEALVVKLGIKDSVCFVGRVSDSELAALYKACLFFILLSEKEGFGIVHLEAMYYGKACVVTDVDASKEIVINNVTGFVIPPRDRVATSKAMQKLCQSKDLRERMGAAGQELVRSRYLPDHFERRVAEYLFQ